MKVSVYKVDPEIERSGEALPIEFEFETKSEKSHKAIKEARAELEKSWRLRSISVRGDGDGLVAYVTEPLPQVQVKERGQAVRHTGVVGGNREIPRRRRNERKGKAR